MFDKHNVYMLKKITKSIYGRNIFTEFIGVTLVNKIIQVAGTQFHNTSSVHCIVCSPPQVKCLAIIIYPPYTLLHLHPSPQQEHFVK